MDAPAHVSQEYPPGVGLRADVEEEHHEKKPVMKKMKDGVRKIKDSITHMKHGHGHGDEHEIHDVDHDDVDEEEGYEEDSEEVVVEPKVHDVHHDDVYEKKGYEKDNEEVVVEPKVHDVPPLYQATAAQNVVGRHEDPNRQENEMRNLGNAINTFDSEDPATPKPTFDSSTPGDQNQQTHLHSTRGEEIGMSPDSPILTSLEATALSAQQREQQNKPNVEKPNPGPEHEQKMATPKPTLNSSTPGDQNQQTHLSSTRGEEIGMSPDSPILTSFEAMTLSNQQGEHNKPNAEKPNPGPEDEQKMDPVDNKPTVYTEKLSAAKGAAMLAALTVYEKVAGAGTAVMEKVHSSGSSAPEGGGSNKGVSAMSFFSEKLQPGEEDRALCEVIKETIQKKEGVEEREVEAGGGKGVVEKIRGAFSNLLGGGGVVSGDSSKVEGADSGGGGVGVNRGDEGKE